MIRNQSDLGRLTHFARFNRTSVLVYSAKHIIRQTAGSAGEKPRLEPFDAPGPIEAISIGPNNLFLLILKSVNNSPSLLLLCNRGLIKLPEVNLVPIATSIHWSRSPSDDHLVLIGTSFGQIFQLTLPAGSPAITIESRFSDKSRLPISSTSSTYFANQRLVFAATYFRLVVLTAPAGNAGFNPVREFLPSPDLRIPIPSFVAHREASVAWLNYSELRIFTMEQIVEGKPGAISVKWGPATQEEPLDFLASPSSSMVLTRFFVLLAGKTCIVGFAVDDGSAVFRFPFNGEFIAMPMTIIDDMRAVLIANHDNLFQIDLTRDSRAERAPSFSTVKAAALESLSLSEQVSQTEILSALLESGQIERATLLLSGHLKKRGKAPKVERICEEFLIFELQIVAGADFVPDFVVEVDDDFDVFGSLTFELQLRAFSEVARKVYDPAVLAVARNSKLAVQLLMEEGNVAEALDRLLKYGASPFAVSSIAFRHKDHLSKLYLRINQSQPVIHFLLPILPYIAPDVPPEALMQLLDALITSNSFHRIDQIIWAISKTRAARSFDKPLYDRLLRVLGDELRQQLFKNPFSTLQHCQAAQMFETAAWIAHISGLHEDAVLTAKLVSRELTIRYIRRAPRALRAKLCQQVDIEIDREEGQEAIRLASKAAVAKELTKMVGELKSLEEQSRESVKFLRELEEWGQGDTKPESSCGLCHRNLSGSAGYRFVCGHAFHTDCITGHVRARLTFLDPEKVAVLDRICETPNPKSDALRLREQLLASDCPICGMIAVEAARQPLVSLSHPKWGLTIEAEPASPPRRPFANAPSLLPTYKS
jgi:hypothetical protein